jgi:outer membrane protein
MKIYINEISYDFVLYEIIFMVARFWKTIFEGITGFFAGWMYNSLNSVTLKFANYLLQENIMKLNSMVILSTVVTVFMLNIQCTSAQFISDDFQIELGAGGFVRPEYPGSDSYQVLPIPYIDIKYQDWFSVSGDSVRANAFVYEGFTIGAVAKFDFGRDEDDDSVLNGLGDIDFAPELGIFIDYEFRQWLIVQTSVRRAIGGHDGIVADAGIYFQNRVMNDKLEYRIGPSLSFSDDQYVEEYYGITPAQSLRSGHPVYSPNGGLNSAGISLALRYALTEKLSVIGFSKVDFLLEEITDSPLAEEDIAPYFGLFLSYKIK